VFLEERRKPEEHLAVHVGRPVRIHGGTDGRAGESILQQRADDGQANLESVSTQCCDEHFVGAVAMLRSVICQLQQHGRVLIYGPQPLGSINAFPDVFGSRLDTALIEVALRDLFKATLIRVQLADEFIPRIGAALLLLPSCPKDEDGEEYRGYYNL
jgi:hypothetical protein